MIIIRVAAQSPAPAVAGAIAGHIRDHRRAIVQAIGPAAINQAVKALALARQYLTQEEIELIIVPSLVDVEIDSFKRTAVRLSAFRLEDLASSMRADGGGYATEERDTLSH